MNEIKTQIDKVEQTDDGYVIIKLKDGTTKKLTADDLLQMQQCLNILNIRYRLADIDVSDKSTLEYINHTLKQNDTQELLRMSTEHTVVSQEEFELTFLKQSN